MKDRLLTLLGAVVAGCIVIMLLMPPTPISEIKISKPTTIDRGQYGLAGLKAWLDKAGIPTLPLRQRYQSLNTHPELSDTHNLLITSLPHNSQSRRQEREKLRAWLEQGNHVLILTALDDWPEWAQRFGGHTIDDFFGELGLTHQQAEVPKQETQDNNDNTDESEDSSVQAPKTETHHLKPSLDHPVVSGVDHIEATWLTSEGHNWSQRGKKNQRSSLILLRDSENQYPGLWQIRVDQGTAWISSYADLFGNVSLGKADNAKLLANIVSLSTNRQGHVIFDDMHHGLSSLYDPNAFFNDERLHHTLWFILILWLVYVLGRTNRFHTNKIKQPLLQLSDHVRATGGLFARRLHRSAVARRMMMHFFNEIRSLYRLPLNGQPVWDTLSHNAKIDNKLLQNTRTLYDRAEEKKRVNLVKLLHCINGIRKNLV